MELTSELLVTFVGGQVLIQETRDFSSDERRGKITGASIDRGLLKLDFEWLAHRQGEDWRNTSVDHYEISLNASRPKKVGEELEVDFPFKGVYLRFYRANDPSNIAQEDIGGFAQTRRLLKKD